MLTEKQIYENIFETNRDNRKYKLYYYNLDYDDTFDKDDMDLYGIDGLSIDGEGGMD